MVPCKEENRYKGLSIEEEEEEELEVCMVVNGDKKRSYAEMVKSVKEVKEVKEGVRGNLGSLQVKSGVRVSQGSLLGSVEVKKKSWADWSDSEDDSEDDSGEYDC